MPKIPQQLIRSIVYLYQNETDARAGKNFGGTGFIVGIPSVGSRWHCYIITNWHVACRGTSIVRINTVSKEIDIIESDPADWVYDQNYDIAVLPISHRIDVNKHEFSVIALESFVDKEKLLKNEIGSGDDIFMAGRFIDLDGKQTNQPSVRFGNISIMPTLIKQPNGQMADSYCVDTHSRTGYSGSPVFVYRTPGYDLSDFPIGQERRLLLSGVNFFGLLGIHWGQFPELWEITSGENLKEIAEKESLILEGKYIRGVSGMTCVLPAWYIIEVLNMDVLKKQREDIDRVGKIMMDNNMSLKG